MVELLENLERALGKEHLHMPENADSVMALESENESAAGAVLVLSGTETRLVDRVLVAWIHFVLPTGAFFDSATINVVMGEGSDAPHLLIEFLFLGPSGLVMLLDMLPRKDLAVNVEYLNRIYPTKGAQAKLREKCKQYPRMSFFTPKTVYLRTILSPLAVTFSVAPKGSSDQEQGSAAASPPPSLDETMREEVCPIAAEFFSIWSSTVSELAKEMEVGSKEALAMVARDSVMMEKSIEADLSANLPRAFGDDTAKRVVKAFKSAGWGRK